MPFHINYSGEAPISTYFRVNAAKGTVGAPPIPENAINQGSSTAGAREAGPSNIPNEGVVYEALENAETDSQPNTMPVASPGTLAKRVTEATTRFISAFRGRTIQGLKVQLPAGYVGVVLRAEGAADGTRHGIDGGEKERQAKKKGKANGKGKEKSTTWKGRVTRSKKRADEENEEAERMDGDDSMDVGDDGGLYDGAGHALVDEEATRVLTISSQFSSFILWHADHPVDEGRDDYARSLTEWTQLAHLIHRVED
ncbi:hypothetical protein D9615_006517 [Tricholomella constricta]|uniref:Uncharacterized protein n=1 Tax=Tricholomella constricta TaxID=117010 RepID=A0A8H5H9X7_9AGAR|nr:hypothetical protein D9615_006517 [Tricholomella constricta]